MGTYNDFWEAACFRSFLETFSGISAADFQGRVFSLRVSFIEYYESISGAGKNSRNREQVMAKVRHFGQLYFKRNSNKAISEEKQRKRRSQLSDRFSSFRGSFYYRWVVPQRAPAKVGELQGFQSNTTDNPKPAASPEGLQLMYIEISGRQPEPLTFFQFTGLLS